MGLFADEGAQFTGGYGMSADQRLKTGAALSSVWDGKAIKRVRAGDGAVSLHGRRLTQRAEDKRKHRQSESTTYKCKWSVVG